MAGIVLDGEALSQPDTWLRVLAISLPLVGAITIWRWGARVGSAQRWVAAIIFGIAGLAALALFLLNRHYACILSPGRASCLVDGLGTLGLFLLDAFFAIRCVVPAAGDKGRDFISMLLLSGALAGIGLAKNLLVLIIFLNLFLFVGHRWLTRKGFQPRILVLRDDYKDGDDR
jgi:NADH:ubiquinone oxidoreductase subunit 4 (subunit M)